MGDRCNFSCCNSFIWCNRLFITLGPSRFWACKIVTGVPAAVPIVGEPLVLVLRGGESVGQSTLTRFYSAHTFVLPVAAAALMLAHFLMIRKQGISGPL